MKGALVDFSKSSLVDGFIASDSLRVIISDVQPSQTSEHKCVHAQKMF